MEDKKYYHLLQICNKEFSCKFHFQNTAALFEKYYVGKTEKPAEVAVSLPQWVEWKKTGKSFDENAEFSLLSGSIGDALLPDEYCIIHAAAINFRGQAFLFTADPGVGKSTQVRSLQEEYPGQFSVISGDRPIIQHKEDGCILVHPSPWNGKEGWCGAGSAQLAGIFCLERGERTEIIELSRKEAVIPIFQSFISTFEEEETILRLAKMETYILQSVKVFRYINGGVPNSTRALYETVFKGFGHGRI